MARFQAQYVKPSGHKLDGKNEKKQPGLFDALRLLRAIRRASQKLWPQGDEQAKRVEWLPGEGSNLQPSD